LAGPAQISTSKRVHGLPLKHDGRFAAQQPDWLPATGRGEPQV